MPRGKALSVDLRKAIIAASSQAKSTYTISKEFNLPRSTVQDIVSLNKRTGSVEIRKKPGRPLLTTRAERRILKKIVKKDRRATAADITVQWKRHIKKDLSVDTCKRALKKLGYDFYKVRNLRSNDSWVYHD